MDRITIKQIEDNIRETAQLIQVYYNGRKLDAEYDRLENLLVNLMAELDAAKLMEDSKWLN